MSEKRDYEAEYAKAGYAAFPSSQKDGMGGEINYLGLTVRDYFAAKALDAIIARNTVAITENKQALAALAYIMADAMLLERAK